MSIIEYVKQRQHIGFVGLTGINYLEVKEGYAKGELVIKAEHLNPIGTVHGGMLFTLADSIGGIAAASRGKLCTTVSSQIQYLSPTLNSKKLIAISEELKSGKRMCNIETLIVDENEKKIAKVLAVYYYLDKDGKAL